MALLQNNRVMAIAASMEHKRPYLVTQFKIIDNLGEKFEEIGMLCKGLEDTKYVVGLG